MSILAALTALLIAGASPEAEAIAADAQTRLLAGEGLPRDFRLQLRVLSPADRYAVVIWLRRSGLLTGPALPLEDMLAPVPAPAPTPPEAP